jgi:3-oxoacyl-[acyl-carrier protein] reductase
MELGLADKVVMIAGATKGLGYGVAYEAAKEGARISLGSRNEEHVNDAVERLSDELQTEVYGTVLDVTDGDSILQWVEQTLDQWGTIDALVTNGGGPPAGSFDNFEDSDWQAAFELTLLSVVRMVRSVLPVMKENKSGAIVTMTSTSIKQPIDNLLLSNVLRPGVVALAKSLSLELAGYNIRVNNLVPGSFATDRMRYLIGKKAENVGVSSEELIAESESNIPLGRFGTVEEFGKAAVFLISEAATYITGETLIVDGGLVRTVW